jgi:hypothetical protein
MTAEILQKCTDTDVEADNGEALVYAIAYHIGVYQNLTSHWDTEAMNVLYLTADSKQAIERRYLSPGSVNDIDRMMIVREADLYPTGENAKSLAPFVNEHREVMR